MAAVADARQRAARLVELSGGRYAGLAQLRRHQESRGRCPDRARDFRQEPRRAGGGQQGARPCPAVEPLRRAAADRKSTRLNSSHSQISYAVFCLKKKKSECT